MKCGCGKSFDIVAFIKSDGTTNQPYDRVIAQCTKCKTIVNTRYDPRDWYTKKQIRVIERMKKGAEIQRDILKQYSESRKRSED